MAADRMVVAVVLTLAAAGAWPQDVDLVRVNKSKRQLELVASGTVMRTYRIALGGSPVGHKEREGDQRTPEGRYLLDYKKENSSYFRAIHISYPDATDIARARALGVSPGGQIMIHGQRNGLGWLANLSQRFDWTDGCIALSNDDMAEVWNLVRAGTAVEIFP